MTTSPTTLARLLNAQRHHGHRSSLDHLRRHLLSGPPPPNLHSSTWNDSLARYLLLPLYPPDNPAPTFHPFPLLPPVPSPSSRNPTKMTRKLPFRHMTKSNSSTKMSRYLPVRGQKTRSSNRKQKHNPSHQTALKNLPALPTRLAPIPRYPPQPLQTTRPSNTSPPDMLTTCRMTGEKKTSGRRGATLYPSARCTARGQD